MSDLVRREDVIKQLKDELYYNNADKGIYVHGTNFWDSELVERIIKYDVPYASSGVGEVMERMTSREICKMLEILIGNTEPEADTAIDEKREKNLMTLIDVGDWLIDGLYYSARHRKDLYASSRIIGERAYATMLEWKDRLAEIEEELA